MLGLYEERYSGFTVKHFHEQLQKRHHYKLGYTVTRLALQKAGLVRPAPRRSAHCELYTDRGSHYFHTPKAGEAVSKSVQTQSLPPRRRGSGAR